MTGRECTFSLLRLWGIIRKEFLQVKRDRLTRAMVVGLPIVQLLLFGYAINGNPRNMPTALVLGEQSQFTRTFEAALRHSGYFSIVGTMDEGEASAALVGGKILFAISLPPDFSRRLLRGERPAILVEADATDPDTIGGAIGALQGIAESVAQKDLIGPLAQLLGPPNAFCIQIHKKFNPESLTRYHVVPGLMGFVLSMTMVMMAGLALAREREHGNMEILLASPAMPLEIIVGKIVPYALIGHVQVALIVAMAMLLFHVPFEGNPLALYVASILFIVTSLAIGIALSSLAKNQLQAMQMALFYLLPNVVLSGFMSPFAGMPRWAQAIGETLPLTHFNRAMRGILLKGCGWADLWPSLWPMALFGSIVVGLSALFFRHTID
ncbi:MAG: ABC transporter permease [Puniceicoccales bacterium]|jgi:ABC-2 type transport system permease protein|nr:ABC transporter permease [Puniceicoccales bacterium]